MKDQLLLLIELQKIDSKIHELEGAMRALPENPLVPSRALIIARAAWGSARGSAPSVKGLPA